MVKMKALRKFYYAKVLVAGDKFEANAQDVQLLVLVGHAEPDVTPEAPTKRAYNRRDMRVEH